MDADTSYPGLDDSWFIGGTTEPPDAGGRARALTRADVLAEVARQRAERPEPDDVDPEIDEVDRRPAAMPPELDDSWFDRPPRR